MQGPKIVGTAPPVREARNRNEGATGVRIVGRKAIAIKRGRLVGEFTGKRAFLAAARAAGSSERLA